ncbi:hypothetical protein SAMN05660652_03572 [Propionivibrio dicarboxylicus]|uniref:Uncharacterized protein n=1 Tax=Propionivibrio dicarboxylicus TaxID=83767 RepID=A0A1G8L8I4_9RHOO|nr:hypothetical protein SAMN05660652_03572 [Propionivibrio dicarboxylicus]
MSEFPSVPNLHYETPSLPDEEANLSALILLRQFDGMPTPIVRQVLRKALFWLDAVTTLDCSAATEYSKAVEGWKRDPAESP